jgi:hypothetical protein
VAGDRKAGLGEAAVDQVGPVLKLPQSPAESTGEVVGVDEGGIGQRAAPQ